MGANLTGRRCPHHPFVDIVHSPNMSPLFETHASTHSCSEFAFPSTLLHLNFSSLQAFEPVDEQFQEIGVQVEGAVALLPSNHAFGLENALVLTPTAGRSNIVIHFSPPRQAVDAQITGARQIKTCFLDSDNQVLCQKTVGTPQYLQQTPEPAEAFPQHQVQFCAESIAKVVIDSDAPFVISDFAFA